MAKKGAGASFQSEVNSDEEWKFIMQKVGLVVVDVYSDWCGPCVGMMSNMKKIKLELGNENLHLVMANADKVKALQRFRGTSEPTWVFIATGQLLKVMYGANAPLLQKTIENELKNEMECIQGTKKRIERAFTELTPEELQKLEEKRALKAAEEEEERKEKEEQLDKVRRRYYERVARKTFKQSVMLYFPHTIEIDQKTKKKVCQPAYKMMALYDQIDMSIKDQLDIQLTKETIPKVFYNSGLVIPKSLQHLIEEQPCMASLISEYDLPAVNQEEEEEKDSKENIVLQLGVVETKLSNLVCGENMDPFNPSPNTVCNEFMLTTPKGVKIPPLWTPKDYISKAAALEVLFPYVVQELGIEMESLPPPVVVMIFPGDRAREILDAAKPYYEDVLNLAFFDSEIPEEARLMCRTIWELLLFPPNKIPEVKMVIALRREQSEPMLVLTQLAPLYLSPDVKQGRKEADIFFPPNLEDIELPDPFGPEPRKEEFYDGEFLVDEDGHRYKEEFIEENGEFVLKKRVIRLNNGKKVEMFLNPGEKVVVPPDDELEGEEEEFGEEMEAEESLATSEVALPTAPSQELDEGPKPTATE